MEAPAITALQEMRKWTRNPSIAHRSRMEFAILVNIIFSFVMVFNANLSAPVLVMKSYRSPTHRWVWKTGLLICPSASSDIIGKRAYLVVCLDGLIESCLLELRPASLQMQIPKNSCNSCPRIMCAHFSPITLQYLHFHLKDDSWLKLLDGCYPPWQPRHHPQHG